MVQPKNEREDLLLSMTKNCETLLKQTHTEPHETLKFKLTKPGETICFKPSFYLGLDSKWMIGLTYFEVYIKFSI